MNIVRCGLVCGEVLDLQENQGQTLATSRQVATVRHSYLEMGRDYHGFHHKVATDNAWSGFDMGHRGLIDQEHIVHPDSGEYLSREVG